MSNFVQHNRAQKLTPSRCGSPRSSHVLRQWWEILIATLANKVAG